MWKSWFLHFLRLKRNQKRAQGGRFCEMISWWEPAWRTGTKRVMNLLAAGQGPLTEQTGILQLFSKDVASDCWEPGGCYEVPRFLRAPASVPPGVQTVLKLCWYYLRNFEDFPKYLYKAIFCFSEQWCALLQDPPCEHTLITHQGFQSAVLPVIKVRLMSESLCLCSAVGGDVLYLLWGVIGGICVRKYM